MRTFASEFRGGRLFAASLQASLLPTVEQQQVMRTTQHITTKPSRQIPVQRRLSSALTGPGLRHRARRSALNEAAITDIVVAALGAAAIVLGVGSLLLA